MQNLGSSDYWLNVWGVQYWCLDLWNEKNTLKLFREFGHTDNAGVFHLKTVEILLKLFKKPESTFKGNINKMEQNIESFEKQVEYLYGELEGDGNWWTDRYG